MNEDRVEVRLLNVHLLSCFYFELLSAIIIYLTNNSIFICNIRKTLNKNGLYTLNKMDQYKESPKEIQIKGSIQTFTCTGERSVGLNNGSGGIMCLLKNIEQYVYLMAHIKIKCDLKIYSFKKLQ